MEWVYTLKAYPRLGCIPCMDAAWNFFQLLKSFIPTKLSYPQILDHRFRLCEVYPHLLRGETHDSGTVRRVTKLEIILEIQIQTFPNLFFVFSILKNHTLKTYPRMDAAWKKGAYPGKRVHTLHGLQKKAVRYTQVSHDKIAFRISITVSPISIEWTVR